MKKLITVGLTLLVTVTALVANANQPPVAKSINTTCYLRGGQVIPFDFGKYLIATDPDNDTVTFHSATVTNGTVNVSPTSIAYTNTAGAVNTTDIINYVVTDGNGGFATNVINVTLLGYNANYVSHDVQAGTITFQGVLGEDYELDHAPTITPPHTWTEVATGTASPVDGKIIFSVQFQDPLGSFRTRHVP